jgi:serine/threonine-protein kinase
MGATKMGMILGTAGYMAPEQARGKAADKRADIWAFGVVLYEMLTGRRAFQGEDISDTLAAVIKEQPRWDGIPANVERLLRSCLEKDPKRRLRDIGDTWRLLDEPAPPEPAHRHRVLPWALGGILAASLFALAWTLLHPRVAASRPVNRWTVTLPESSVTYLALDHEGTRLVYADASGPLMLRLLNEFEGKPLVGTDRARGPVFSPDGQWIAYSAAATSPPTLKKVPVTGGASITLYPGVAQAGRTWGNDDTIVVGTAKGLMRVSAAGGEPQPLTKVDAQKGEILHAFPEFIRGSPAIVFTIRVSGSNDRIAVFDPRQSSYRVVVNDGSTGRYIPTGHLVYTRAGTLFGVPFDAQRLVVTGPETPLIEGVSSAGRFLAMAGVPYTVSDSGLLMYLSGTQETNSLTLEWVDRQGSAQASTAPPQVYRQARLSPDGKRVAASITNPDGVSSDVWVCELERGTLVRLTFAARNGSPAWTPNGRSVAFSSNQAEKYGIYQVAADGSGKPELLTETGVMGSATTWTPDGKTLLYSTRSTPGPEAGIWTLSLDGRAGENKPQPFLQSGFVDANPQLSPDGRWVAYQSNESGKAEVYVRPFPGPGGKVAISTQGGGNPRWSRAGRELFYQDLKNRILSVEVQTSPAFQAGQPQALFELHGDPALGPNLLWDVAPDGKRFLVSKPSETQAAGTKLQVVENWFEELHRRIATGGK